MSDFDFKIWFTKGIKKAILVGIFSSGTAFLDYAKVTDFPAEYVAYTGFAFLIADLALNWYKHTFIEKEEQPVSP